MFNKRSIKTLHGLGFEDVQINEHGQLTGWFPKSRRKEIVVVKTKDGVKAWVLVDQNPKTITRHYGAGITAQYTFNTVKEAGQNALDYPHYG